MEEAVVRARLYYLAETGTLDLWIGELSKEFIAEPVNGNTALKLDREGSVIGLEIINLKNLKPEDLEGIPKTLGRF